MAIRRLLAVLASAVLSFSAFGQDCKTACLMQMHNCLTAGSKTADQCQAEYTACTGNCPAK
jgi:hypothetical protein